MGIAIKDVNSNTVNALVSPNKRINIDEPRYDQSTYIGRAKHFFITTNPLNLLCTSEDLDKAKDVVTRYKNGETMSITEDELWRAKSIYDSAFHPDTGEKLVLVGRMSAQVPMNMFITGAMLTFYKSSKQVIFWQWFNQSFNAIVNYSNRSGDSPISVPQLAGSYVAATSGALITALGLNSLVKRAPSIVGRFVPFTAVAAANCVNIPFMRSNEIKSGMQVYHEDGTFIGKSPTAAKEGVVQVVISRICMAVPSMVIPPIIMDRLEKKGFLKRFPWASAPMQILMCGFCLTFATPFGCALFPQKASIEVSKLEPELQERIRALPNPPTVVYYNKGL